MMGMENIFKFEQEGFEKFCEKDMYKDYLNEVKIKHIMYKIYYQSIKIYE